MNVLPGRAGRAKQGRETSVSKKIKKTGINPKDLRSSLNDAEKMDQ